MTRTLTEVGVEINDVEPLAIGLFSMIFRGRQDESEDRVAVKVREEILGNEGSVIKNEFEVLKSCNHENICRALAVTDMINDTGVKVHFLVMSYLGEIDLYGLLDLYKLKRQLFSQDGLKSIVSQLASALEHLCSQKIIHRKIRPKSVLISESGRVVLGSFGSALAIAFKESTASFYPDARFDAPEVNSPPVTFSYSSDMFSLGRILQQLLDLSIKRPNEFVELSESMTADDPSKRPKASELVGHACLQGAFVCAVPMHFEVSELGKWQANIPSGRNPIHFGRILHHSESSTISRAVNTAKLHALAIKKSSDLKSLQRQAAILKCCHHASICRFISLYRVDDETHLFAMSFAGYYNMEKLINTMLDQGNQFVSSEINYIMQRLFEAVAYLHNKGIVHNDIAPANVVFSCTGMISLVGFSKATLVPFGDTTQKQADLNGLALILYAVLRLPSLLVYGIDVSDIKNWDDVPHGHRHLESLFRNLLNGSITCQRVLEKRCFHAKKKSSSELNFPKIMDEKLAQFSDLQRFPFLEWSHLKAIKAFRGCSEGNISRAYDIMTRSVVLLKMPSTEFEYELMSKFEHQNIMQVRQTFAQEELVLLMEGWGNWDLKIVLEATEQYDINIESHELNFLGHQIMNALAYLHRHGVVHTQLRLHTILMNNEGRLKIFDMNQAELIYGETESDFDVRSAMCVLFSLLTRKEYSITSDTPVEEIIAEMTSVQSDYVKKYLVDPIKRKHSSQKLFANKFFGDYEDRNAISASGSLRFADRLFDFMDEGEKVNKSYESEDQHIELTKHLGSGAFASVYKAKAGNELIAVKVVSWSSLDAVEQKLIENEFELQKRCDHENILKVYDEFYAEEEDCTELIITMQLFQGWELLDVMQALEEHNQWFVKGEAQLIVAQVVDAVNYLHSIGILHRDIKYDNIMINRYGQAKLIDFSLAALMDETGSVAGNSGTLGWASPESAQECYATTASDWFTVGVLLYCFIFGGTPNEGMSTAAEEQFKVDYSWGMYLEDNCDALDLTKSLLRFRPEHRATYSDIIQHTFYCGLYRSKCHKDQAVKAFIAKARLF